MIYIAGPFFNKRQMNFIQQIERAFDTYGISYISPRKAGVLKDMTPEDKAAKMRKIYDDNVRDVYNADCIVAVIDDHDTGTMFEVGYATAFGKRILTITNHDYKLNVMLRFATQGHFNSIDQLINCLNGHAYKTFEPEVY